MAKKIYYAHSMQIYNTEQEKKELKYLNILSKHNVIDPNDKTFPENKGILPFLKAINKCDILVCSEFNNYIGFGVYQEILFALGKGMPCFVIRKKKLKKIKYVDIHDKYDWKIYFAKIK